MHVWTRKPENQQVRGGGEQGNSEFVAHREGQQSPEYPGRALVEAMLLQNHHPDLKRKEIVGNQQKLLFRGILWHSSSTFQIWVSDHQLAAQVENTGAPFTQVISTFFFKLQQHICQPLPSTARPK